MASQKHVSLPYELSNDALACKLFHKCRNAMVAHLNNKINSQYQARNEGEMDICNIYIYAGGTIIENATWVFDFLGV